MSVYEGRRAADQQLHITRPARLPPAGASGQAVACDRHETGFGIGGRQSDAGRRGPRLSPFDDGQVRVHSLDGLPSRTAGSPSQPFWPERGRSGRGPPGERCRHPSVAGPCNKERNGHPARARSAMLPNFMFDRPASWPWPVRGRSATSESATLLARPRRRPSVNHQLQRIVRSALG